MINAPQTTPAPAPAPAGVGAAPVQVRSVAADEGLIWSLTDPGGRLLGSAAAAFSDPISAADLTTADIALWIAPEAATPERWTALLGAVLDALDLLDADRIVARCPRDDAERLRHLTGAGFRVAAVEPDGSLRLERVARR